MSKKAGIRKVELFWPQDIPLDEISVQFIQGMLDRCAVGFYNYGPTKNSFPHVYNALECADKRRRHYKKTHNTENLIDEANYLMFEFMHPRDPRAFFEATDKSGSPGAVTVAGKVVHGQSELTEVEQRRLRRR